MTPEQKRITIAEICGYTLGGPAGKDKGIIGWMYEGKYIPKLPDYLNDLNAMHEAEKVLSELYEQYAEHLHELCGDWRAAIGATATERADAFLLTFGHKI